VFNYVITHKDKKKIEENNRKKKEMTYSHWVDLFERSSTRL